MVSSIFDFLDDLSVVGGEVVIDVVEEGVNLVGAAEI